MKRTHWIALTLSGIPGQSVLLHDIDSTASPAHSFPSLSGVGLLQRRTRVTLPSPQVVEHSDQFPQFPHSPLTITIQQKNILVRVTCKTLIFVLFKESHKNDAFLVVEI